MLSVFFVVSCIFTKAGHSQVTPMNVGSVFSSGFYKNDPDHSKYLCSLRQLLRSELLNPYTKQQRYANALAIRLSCFFPCLPFYQTRSMKLLFCPSLESPRRFTFRRLRYENRLCWGVQTSKVRDCPPNYLPQGEKNYLHNSNQDKPKHILLQVIFYA